MPTKQQVRIRECLEAVMSQCDGAHDLDGAGYSRFDRPIAEDLLAEDLWDEDETESGRHLCVKYQGQLEGMGCDWRAAVNRGLPYGVKTEWDQSNSSVLARPVSVTRGTNGDRRERAPVAVRSATVPSPAVNCALPPPSTLGLPDKFGEWRHDQDKAVLRALDSTKRFVVLNVPTGGGKSLIYTAAAHLSGLRTAILTSTKALQDQLRDDFHETGLIDIRGANNYDCVESKPRPGEMFRIVSCDHGPCRAGMKCDAQGDGCLYYDQVRVATNSNLLVTNYSYWMHKQSSRCSPCDPPDMKRTGIGSFDMLVLDEAHNAPDELGSYLSTELSKADVESILLRDFPDYLDIAQWKTWAVPVIAKLHVDIEILRADLKAHRVPWREKIYQLRAMERLCSDLAKIAQAKGEWLVDIGRRGSAKKISAQFDPVWPAPYAEENLFFGIKKVILTSATVRPKTLQLLGVRESEIDFVEYPSVFPKERRPIISVSTIRVDNRTSPGEMRMWVAKIDAIIRNRLDRKGIIHTVSYDRARFIVQYSEFKDIMLMHETRTAREVVEKFKSGHAPLVLVSPSMTTGFDFPADQCRYQIIAKVPFPDTRNRIMAARTKADPTYGHYITMQQLVQACGRGNRSADDWCENIIIDDHFLWFGPKCRKFAPNWFMAAWKVSKLPPVPLEFK